MRLIDINKTKALAYAERMAIPSMCTCETFIDFERLNIISKELKGSRYHCVAKNKLFHLYAQKDINEVEGPLLLISSHADALQKEPVFQEKCEEDKGCMRGIFDNAITNAACVYLMTECDLSENVIFAFTGDEEHTSNGARNVCKYLEKFNKPVQVIVLDVTSSGYEEKADFTIENDFVYKKDKQWIKEVIHSAKESGLAWKFIPADPESKEANADDYYDLLRKIKRVDANRLCFSYAESIEFADLDETEMYDDNDLSCFSLCLPCAAKDGEMHSNKGFMIRRNSYYHYIAFLYQLCCSTNTKEDRKEEVRMRKSNISLGKTVERILRNTEYNVQKTMEICRGKNIPITEEMLQAAIEQYKNELKRDNATFISGFLLYDMEENNIGAGVLYLLNQTGEYLLFKRKYDQESEEMVGTDEMAALDAYSAWAEEGGTFSQSKRPHPGADA